MGLLRLQSMYSLNKTQLSEGLLVTNYSQSGKPYIERFIPMTIGDCFELAMELYRMNYYDQGVMWMHEAVRKFENQLFNDDHRYSRRDIMYQLNHGYDALDQFIKNFEPWIARLKARYPTVNLQDKNYLWGCYREKRSLEATFKSLQMEDKYEQWLEEESGDFDAYEENIFFHLCRHAIPASAKTTKRLKCHYKYGPHPFLRLARVKMELLHRNPDVIMYHDVISDAEIELLKKFPHPLERCEVHDGDVNKTSPDRICKGVFLNESFPLTLPIRRRISHFTDLDLVATERLVLTNYGIGGHFAPHYDFWIDEKTIKEQGNRIATTVIYLSNVEQGGATVFLSLRLTIFPVKGAALFWRNLLPSGDFDFQTFHTGCPVLRGTKWILTQWINIRGQEIRRPCPANYKKK
ncbi:prolyl 4-hydroxylase subunit alpha-1-like [Pectinophora gossypiella]|uniref:prolyl 4-hydroxylase subunit alpha-1-like n=1 Tax=Pectinophora gossypiella TaxID=13191 RepID=UPI00214E62B0|nr:prolyl 4-hydroxylase subunit alpha-1-like [Pectinophora gossypiella]